MRRFSIDHILIVSLLALILMLGAGCQSDPVKGEDDSTDIDWPDLTAPEDVVETIRLVYQNFNRAGSDELMEHYAAVLNQDYIWHMQPGDVEAYGLVMLREEDIAGTRYIIEQSSALMLDISEATWNTAEEICDECLQTTRVYTISTTIKYWGEIGCREGVDMGLMLIIGPNAQVPGTWAIYIASDLPAS